MARRTILARAVSLFFVLIAGATGQARADDFFLGFDAASGNTEWCNHTTATTVFVNVGPTLTANQVFNLTAGPDRAAVLRLGPIATACGSLTPINYGGFTVTINGGTGDDIISGGGGPTRVVGNDGNDHLIIRVGPSRAEGNDGDDCLLSNAPAGGEEMFGGNGDDCLDQANGVVGPAAAFDCGLNVDKFRAKPGTVPVMCEFATPAGCGCVQLPF